MGSGQDIAAGGAIGAYIAPPYAWLVFIVIVIYLATVGYLWSYLHRRHPAAWEQLGSPIMTQPSITSAHSVVHTLGFIFGRKYQTLNDIQLTRTIWIIRALLLLTAALIVAGKVSNLLPPN
jgi:hypothetical protein